MIHYHERLLKSEVYVTVHYKTPHNYWYNLYLYIILYACS